MFQAENFLTIYENASCVITDRLHCALPCLALNTPVLFIDTAQYGLERLGGLTDLVRKATFEDYKNDYSIFDVEKPPKNPDDYLKLRKDLIKRTKEFTGHINDSYLMNDSNRLYNNVNLLCKTSRKTKKYMRDVDGIINDYQNEIEKKNRLIEEQKRKIEELENSKSGKFKLFKR